jgi:hypothetical protein
MYSSNKGTWTVGCPSDALFNYEKPYTFLGYQGYNQSNLVKNPGSLGGLWFGRRVSKRGLLRSHKKARRGSKKTRRGSKKSRKSRFGQRMMTPGGVTTENSWGFTNIV